MVPSLPTGTVTFLLSDVAESTMLWEEGEDAAAAAVARHYELLDAAISCHGGVRPIEQGEGDSVVAAFVSPADALAAALDAQRAFVAEPWPTAHPVRIRVALHTGEARLRDEGNYFGPTIIRCARLRSAGHGGQTLLSDAVRDAVVDVLTDDVTLRSLGTHRLKDLTEPERVWQLCHPDIPAEFPSLVSLDAFPNNLAAPLTAFVGRDPEIAALRDVLDRNRLVTLTGAGGCGKTRLALQLAAEVVEDHPGGTWWVELAAVSDPETVTAVVATTLGVRAEPERPLVETLIEYLRGRNVLIVLDNCEQVVGASAGLAEELLGSVPGLVMMTTSREALGVAGEVVWRVPSLDAASAASLFVDRATAARPGFAPDSTDSEAIVRICERLDGIPLAIELAAARTRMMRPAEIAAGLDGRFRLLTGGARTALPRQQTLEASVAWSHDLLDEPQRIAFRRLSVFRGGFTLEAAEVVCADGTVDRYAVLDLLGRLVDKSLVQAADRGLQTRYRLLETIRQYAGDRLIESGESEAVRARHCAWFADYAELAAPELERADGAVWLARLDAEHDNLQAALEWADAAGDHEVVLRMVAALCLFWEARGHRHQGIGGRWLARALAAESGPSVAHARALWAAGHMGIYGGDIAVTLMRAPEALAMAEEIGDQWTLVRATNTYNFLVGNFDPPTGLTAIAANIAVARSIDDDWAVADGLKVMSIVLGVAGDYPGVMRVGTELLQLASRIGNKFFLAWAHAVLGYVACHHGDVATARDRLDAALALCDDIGDPITRWLALCWLGEVDALTGDYDVARGRYEAVLSQGFAADGDLARHWAIPDLGGLLLGLGDIEGARTVIEPALEDFQTEVPLISAPFHLTHAELSMAIGDDDGARVALDSARVQITAIGNPMLEAALAEHSGRLAYRMGDTAGSQDFHHQALTVRHREGLLPGIVESLEALGVIAADQQSAREAARLLGAASAIRQQLGLVRRPVDHASFEDGRTRAAEQLDSAEFAAAWTEGEALTIDEVVAYASRARGERKRPSSGWASLTPTELDVAKLTAEGLTNPEIGERLFIGRGTVKTHLSHIFTKLSVSTRAELASQVTRRNL